MTTGFPLIGVKPIKFFPLSFLDDKSQRTASDVNIARVNVTLRQLEGLEQNLEKLFTQVQTMKENLTSSTDNSLKLAEL